MSRWLYHEVSTCFLLNVKLCRNVQQSGFSKLFQFVRLTKQKIMFFDLSDWQNKKSCFSFCQAGKTKNYVFRFVRRTKQKFMFFVLSAWQNDKFCHPPPQHQHSMKRHNYLQAENNFAKLKFILSAWQNEKSSL